MADKGSSHWNGNYGSDETERRKNYDRGVVKLKMIDTFGIPSIKRNYNANEARKIDEAVPRRQGD